MRLRSSFPRFSVLTRWTLQHPFVRRIVLEMPFARRARHHVQVVRIVSVWHDYRMIATRDHDHVVILDRDCLVERAIVAVDALESESLRGIEAMVIRLLERALERQVVGVVL